MIILRNTMALYLLGWGAISLGGCASTEQASTPDSNSPANAAATPQNRPAPTQAPTPSGNVTAPPANAKAPVGITHNTAVRTAVMPLGTIPYDNFALPMVSPDGLYLASEVGVAPEFETVVADVDAPTHDNTQIQVFELTYGPNAIPKELFTLGQSVMLGRSCNDRGLLVERHYADGSRWIGQVGWTDGRVEWLVQNSETNAFACIGPQGQLAWSRRKPGAARFDLVIQQADGRQFSIATDEDWLFPTWSGRDNGLFVFVLRRGILTLTHLRASDPIAARQTMSRLEIATRATVDTAYNAVVSQPVAWHPQRTVPIREEFIFVHPTERRAAIWRPRAPRERALTYFDDRSYAAAFAEEGQSVLISTQSALRRQILLGNSPSTELMRGLLIPRQISGDPWSHLLLSPRDGSVGLSAVTLLTN